MDRTPVNRLGAEVIWIWYQIGRLVELRVALGLLGNQVANTNKIGAASFEAPYFLECSLLFGA